MGQADVTAKTAAAFALLGLRPGADEVEIRRAWKALVRAYHPDRCREDRATTNRRLADINAAFDLVSAWRPAAKPANDSTHRKTAARPTRQKTSPPPIATPASRQAGRANCRDAPGRAMREIRQPPPAPPSLAAAIQCFREAQSVLGRKPPVRCLGIV
jgi:hypothetical protein